MSEYTKGTREWAEAMARAGAKVRHERWGEGEWVTFEDGLLLDDTGKRTKIGGFYDGSVGLWLLVYPADTDLSKLAVAPNRDSLPDLAARVAALEAERDKPTPALRQAYEAAKKAGAFDDPSLFTTSRNPPTLVVGGQYRTRGGWRCVVVKAGPDGPLVWHDHENNFTPWWHERDGRMEEDLNFDILGRWEPEA